MLISFSKVIFTFSSFDHFYCSLSTLSLCLYVSLSLSLSHTHTHTHIYIYIYNQCVILIAWIPMTHRRPPSSIALGRSSRRHPTSVQSRYIWVFVRQPNFCVSIYGNAYEFVLAFLRCPLCHDCLTWMICETEGTWFYSSSFEGCHFKDLFEIAIHACILRLEVFFFLALC